MPIPIPEVKSNAIQEPNLNSGSSSSLPSLISPYRPNAKKSKKNRKNALSKI